MDRGMRLNAYADRDLRRRAINVTFIGNHADGRTSVLQPITVQSYTAAEWDDRSAAPLLPTLSLPFETAQDLMDELWRCGLRPAEAKGDDTGQVKAMSAHLDDLRGIARHALKIPAK